MILKQLYHFLRKMLSRHILEQTPTTGDALAQIICYSLGIDVEDADTHVISVSVDCKPSEPAIITIKMLDGGRLPEIDWDSIVVHRYRIYTKEKAE